MKCTDNLCPYLGNVHYHCNQNRCLYVTDKEDVLIMHSKDFHDNIDILDGFEFYDRNVDCRLPKCPSNKINRHFHCTRSNCNYSFVQYSTMAMHNQKHVEESKNNTRTSPINVKIKNEPMDEKTIADHNDVAHQLRAINLSQQQQQMQQQQQLSHVTDNKISGKFIRLSF